jgi:hypothetical protein
MKRVFALLVAGVLFAAVYAAAATLDVDGGVIQAGLDDSLVCDPDGVTVTWVYENDDLMVYKVKIGDIHADCFGEEMHVDLYGSGGGHIAGGDCGSVVLSTSPTSFNCGPAYAPDIYEIHVGID